jgi:hypothetical protein
MIADWVSRLGKHAVEGKSLEHAAGGRHREFHGAAVEADGTLPLGA